jgi:hypothetical protein
VKKPSSSRHFRYVSLTEIFSHRVSRSEEMVKGVQLRALSKSFVIATTPLQFWKIPSSCMHWVNACQCHVAKLMAVCFGCFYPEGHLSLDHAYKLQVPDLQVCNSILFSLREFLIIVGWHTQILRQGTLY